MISVLATVLLSGALMVHGESSHGLDITARLGMVDADRVIVFTLVNKSNDTAVFNRALSPCAPYELGVVVLSGPGGLAHVIERLPLIADTIGQRIQVAAHAAYTCNFNISQWFSGKIPKGEQSILLWSFRPSTPGVFARPLYGGAMLLQE